MDENTDNKDDTLKKDEDIENFVNYKRDEKAPSRVNKKNVEEEGTYQTIKKESPYLDDIENSDYDTDLAEKNEKIEL